MANHKSAKKRSVQAIKRTLINKVKTTEVRSVLKNLREVIANKNKDEALKLFPQAQKLLAKLAQSNIIKKETASRTTGRLGSQVHKL